MQRVWYALVICLPDNACKASARADGSHGHTHKRNFHAASMKTHAPNRYIGVFAVGCIVWYELAQLGGRAKVLKTECVSRPAQVRTLLAKSLCKVRRVRIELTTLGL